MDLRFPLRAAFLAVPLDESSRWEFQALQESLRDYEDILSFQSSVTPHLTLQYWKELMEIEYRQIVPQSERITTSTEAFDLKIEGIGTFGNRGDDHVLFLEIPFSEQLARLKKRCPWPSLDPFHPHVTLARIRHPQRFAVAKKKILKLLGNPSFVTHVDRLRLYAEIGGIKQTPLREFLLG